MSSAHLHVHLGDGAAEGRVSVLLVHVDGVSSREVSKNDSVVLDRLSFLLEDLSGGNDLSLNLSDLVLSLHEIPELGSRQNGITGEHSHSVERRRGVLLGRQGSADNEKLSQLKEEKLVR